MTLTLVKTTVPELQARRQQHFARLGQAPELYMELMVQSCSAYDLSVSGEPAGHLLTTPDGTLFEWSLSLGACKDKESLFAEACRELAIRNVYGYSFDSTLVSLCIECGAIGHPYGILYRDFNSGTLGQLPTLRPAVESDIAAILPIREGVFEEEEQVPQWVRSGWVSVLEDRGEFLGIGLCSPVWPELRERDVGVLVHPAKRGSGHGARILASVAEKCLRVGLVPTAGCAYDNAASRGALRRAGFVSRHSLIRFELGARSVVARV